MQFCYLCFVECWQWWWNKLFNNHNYCSYQAHSYAANSQEFLFLNYIWIQRNLYLPNWHCYAGNSQEFPFLSYTNSEASISSQLTFLCRKFPGIPISQLHEFRSIHIFPNDIVMQEIPRNSNFSVTRIQRHPYLPNWHFYAGNSQEFQFLSYTNSEASISSQLSMSWSLVSTWSTWLWLSIGCWLDDFETATILTPCTVFPLDVPAERERIGINFNYASGF